jgi:hypothetical protein
MSRESFYHSPAVVTRVVLYGLLGVSLLSLVPVSVENLAFPLLQPIANAKADETVDACGGQNGQSPIFAGYSAFGIRTINYCGVGGWNLELLNDDLHTVAPGASSGLIANAPSGLLIADATVPSMQLSGTVGSGYIADMVWTGGQQRVDDNWHGYSISLSPPRNGFGFTLACAGPSSCPSNGAFIGMNEVQLNVVETIPPALVFNAGSLWYEGSVGAPTGTHWVRGSWPLGFSASAPSGIEVMSAAMAGETISGPLAPTCAPDQTAWQQCPNSVNWTPMVSLSGNGDEPLTLRAMSSAKNSSSPTEIIHVDTTQPTISLIGPAEASSTAGTQYVTATASVGPSGLGSISCSMDGGPPQSYASSPASIPVSGLGVHAVQCAATNRSYDPQGQPATSTPASFSIDIGQPTLNAISFSKLVNALKCRKVKERVKVAAKWVTLHRHGKTEKVYRRAHKKTIKVVKCHPRTVKRKVTVWVKIKRHGKLVMVKRKKIERVIVAPRVLSKSTERVRHGKGTTVNGWLGTSDGVALAGRTVDVMTAPDNGLGQWTQLAVVTTAGDGTWSLRLPAGPSRLVEAAYAGDSVALPSSSAPVHLTVPAKVKIHISPRSTRWNGTITITGRVLGGYIPAGKLLRLRIGVEGVRATVGIPDVRRNGRFRTTWKFSAGNGVVHYWFSVSTLNEADYPYAPASSRRVSVRVGPR